MDSRLYAYLSYRDAPAALAWMEHVGFTIIRRQDSETGDVAHAEVRMGDVVIMVASADADYQQPALIGKSTGGGLYLLIGDVDEFYQRALSGGGTAVIAPEDTQWGTRRMRVLDPEGHEWSAGTYDPGAGW